MAYLTLRPIYPHLGLLFLVLAAPPPPPNPLGRPLRSGDSTRPRRRDPPPRRPPLVVVLAGSPPAPAPFPSDPASRVARGAGGHRIRIRALAVVVAAAAAGQSGACPLCAPPGQRWDPRPLLIRVVAAPRVAFASRGCPRFASLYLSKP